MRKPFLFGQVQTRDHAVQEVAFVKPARLKGNAACSPMFPDLGIGDQEGFRGF
jgi:hypothetical protein